MHEFFTCKTTNLYISYRPICKIPVNTPTIIRSCLYALRFDLTTLIGIAVYGLSGLYEDEEQLEILYPLPSIKTENYHLLIESTVSFKYVIDIITISH